MQIKIPLLPPTVDQSPSTPQQVDQCFSLARRIAKLESRDLAAMLAAKLILKTPEVAVLENPSQNDLNVTDFSRHTLICGINGTLNCGA